MLCSLRKTKKMNKSLEVTLAVDLSAHALNERSPAPLDGQALALALSVIEQLLPRLAEATGVELRRLTGSLLAELGYTVGLLHAPAFAVDTLAVATRRQREAILPMPTVPGPAGIQ